MGDRELIAEVHDHLTRFEHGHFGAFALMLTDALERALSGPPEREGWVRRPITMGDVRLAVGEGPLKPADVLAGCNAEMRRRGLLSAAPKPEAAG